MNEMDMPGRPSTPCEEWAGRRSREGYGQEVGGKPAHRAAWERARGAIPHRMVIDHLCFNRACINVEHLRVVDNVTNSRRSRRALRDCCGKCGRPYDAENTYLVRRKGRGFPYRSCRACQSAAVARYKCRREAVAI